MNKFLKAKIRCKKYRKKILEISQGVSSLHIGGAFSSVEIVDCIYNMIKKNTETNLSRHYEKNILRSAI